MPKTIPLLLALCFLLLTTRTQADSPPLISSDINWTDTGGVFDVANGIFNATFNGVIDIEAAFNNARRAEEIQLSLSANCYGDMNLPGQSEWDAKTDSAKALFLLNEERSARGGLCGTNAAVLGLPFEDTEDHVIDLAQSYADVLIANNAFQHQHPVDGTSPSDRLNNDPFIGSCNEFLAQVENLAAFWTSGSSNPLPVERSVYNFIYNDSGSSWGHRTAALLQDTTLAGNPWGYTNNNNSGSSEGYIGIGVASAQNYILNGFFGTVVVMKMFDPVPASATCNYDTGTPAPTGFFELVSPTASIGDRFGYSVSIDGDYAVVGSRLDDLNTYTNNGAAHVYMKTGTTEWVHVKTLEGISDVSADQDKFGHSVAISGNTIAVSAETDDDNGFRSGLVYIFERNAGGTNNWGMVTNFAASTTQTSDYFGRSISLSGDTLIVGAHLADDNGSASGAAYIFERNEGGIDNWGQVAALDPTDGAAGDIFGNSVAIDGDYAVVSAMRDDDGGLNAGSAYVFSRSLGGTNNWGLVKKLVSSSTMAADQFGYSVDIDGDSIVVGARLADDSTSGQNQVGAAYVFKRNQGGSNNWGEQQRILASDLQAGDRLGASVALSGNRLVVGATHVDDNGDNAGKAYHYVESSGVWTEQSQIINPTVSTRDYFGTGLDVDGQTALVGAWLDNRGANNSGGAFVQYLP